MQKCQPNKCANAMEKKRERSFDDGRWKNVQCGRQRERIWNGTHFSSEKKIYKKHMTETERQWL